jgi:hypothetical protein
MATIEVSREEKKATDRLRGYKVVIDGAAMGRIRNGETVSFEVSPGSHEVQMRMDWKRSEPFRVEATNDTPTRLVVRPTYGVLGGGVGSGGTWITLAFAEASPRRDADPQ